MIKHAGLLAGFAVYLTCLPSNAQDLNSAVTAQLRDTGNQPCGLLLSGDSPDVLGSGGLFEICTRIVHDPPIAEDPGSGTPSDGVGVMSSMPRATFGKERDLHEDGKLISRADRGFFFSLGVESANRYSSPFEDGYDSTVLRIDAALDWAIGENLTLGIATDLSEQQADFSNGGEFELRTLGWTGFGSYWIGDNGAIDIYAGQSRQWNERVRRSRFRAIGPTAPFSVVGMPASDFDAGQLRAGAHYSHDWRWRNVAFGPRLGYEWIETTTDSYSEVDDSGLALRFYEDVANSSQFSGGVAASATVPTDFGALLLSGSIIYKYEDDLDQRFVEVSFVEDTRGRRFAYQTERPDREFIDYFIAATFVMPHGLQVFALYRGIESHDYLYVSTGTIGFRMEF